MTSCSGLSSMLLFVFNSFVIQVASMFIDNIRLRDLSSIAQHNNAIIRINNIANPPVAPVIIIIFTLVLSKLLAPLFDFGTFVDNGKSVVIAVTSSKAVVSGTSTVATTIKVVTHMQLVIASYMFCSCK